jgi:hypothetical protein
VTRHLRVFIELRPMEEKGAGKSALVEWVNLPIQRGAVADGTRGLLEKFLGGLGIVGGGAW